MSTSSGSQEQTKPGVFDAFAADYDASFTDSTLGRMLRARVWRQLSEHFSPDSRLLELACGTGEDALWLARHGHRVTATDGAAGMVQATRRKAAAADMTAHISVHQMSLQEIIADPDRLLVEPGYDGVLSDFGGLNTIADWAPLAEALATLVRPGGKLVLAPMGPICPWEIGWYLLHFQRSLAIRRFRQPAWAQIGTEQIPIWYPSAGRLRKAFAPWFSHRRTLSLGLWLPPSSLAHFVDRLPRLFSLLNRLEAATARLTSGWGDHYIMVLEKPEQKA